MHRTATSPSAPAGPARRRRWIRPVAMGSTLALAGALSLAVAVGPAAAAPTTVVSLTFDDGTADEFTNARPLLQARGMPATFYVNSTRIGSGPTYMSLQNLQTLAAEGHEIGGHTLTHANLPTLGADDAAREICNDRVALLGMGFDVRTFAYPFGASSAAVQATVQNCGYNAARGVGGLLRPGGCSGCPTSVAVPPPAPYYIPTPDSVRTTTTLAQLQGMVTQAENGGGGWVPLVFHHVCDGCDATYSTSPALLESFLDWLALRAPNGTTVKTVHQVVGGALQPGVPGPVAPGPPGGVQNSSLEAATGSVPTCFQLGGFGTSTVTWTRTTDAHSGTYGERVDVTAFTSGDRKLVTKQDAGTCAPGVQGGSTYTLGIWYRGSWASAVPVKLSVYLRNGAGVWSYWTTGPAVAASSGWSQATLTTPAVPSGSTAISFGLSLAGVGWVVTDDYSLAKAT